ncbi:unnamed protein product [Ixodes pacificus]
MKQCRQYPSHTAVNIQSTLSADTEKEKHRVADLLRDQHAVKTLLATSLGSDKYTRLFADGDTAILAIFFFFSCQQ